MQQNTNEWLEFRKNKIGSSDAPVIMKKDPWRTPFQLWQQKLGIDKGKKETSAMRRGKDLESKALECFQEKTGLVMWPDVISHPENEFMIASMDGISMDNKAAVEIKCPGKTTCQMAKEGKIPDHYQIQMQHQLAVTELDKMFYFCFDGQDGIVLELGRDDTFIKKLIEEEEEFYRRIVEYDPPQQEHVYRNDEQWKSFRTQYQKLDEEIKRLSNEKQLLKEQMIESANHSNCAGEGLKLTKFLSKGCIDYKKIPELKQIDLEKYRSSQKEQWRITITQ